MDGARARAVEASDDSSSSLASLRSSVVVTGDESCEDDGSPKDPSLGLMEMGERVLDLVRPLRS